VAGEGDGEVETREGLCENCARHDAELVAVHRIYLTPEAWDTPGSATTLDELEWWCFSCRSMYPHRLGAP